MPQKCWSVEIESCLLSRELFTDTVSPKGDCETNESSISSLATVNQPGKVE